MKHLTTLILFLAASTSIADAQTSAPWNRGITSLQRVSLNGLPPGTRFLLDVDWYATAHSGLPLPFDISSRLEVSVNGLALPGSAHTEAMIKTGDLGDCSGGANGYCNLAACAYYDGSGTTRVGSCVRAADIGCDCGLAQHTTLALTGVTISVGDVITVVVVPESGAQPELYTADDARVYVVQPDSPFSSTCEGNGSLATHCPCGNHGSVGRGCANSVVGDGALLTADGSTAVDSGTGTDTVVLHGSGMPSTATSIYLKGDAYDPSGVVFGDGVLCVSGALIRLRTKINAGGASQFPEPGDPSLSQRGQTPPGSGLTGHYQVYYRNSAAFCTAATFNVSNGMKVEW